MYAKVFSQIFDSSIAVDHEVRHVFMDLLVLADAEGVVDMTVDAIARRTNTPIEMVARALEVLASPDPSSRSPDEDGRRLRLVDSHRDWGWLIVNYEHYREIRDEEGRRKYFRDYQRQRRAMKRGESPCQQVSTPVKDSSTLLNGITHAEAEAEEKEEAKAKKKREGRFAPPALSEVKLAAAKTGLSDLEAEKFHAHYESNGWTQGRGKPIKSWRAALTGWKLRAAEYAAQRNGQLSTPAKPADFNDPEYIRREIAKSL